MNIVFKIPKKNKKEENKERKLHVYIHLMLIQALC